MTPSTNQNFEPKPRQHNDFFEITSSRLSAVRAAVQQSLSAVAIENPRIPYTMHIDKVVAGLAMEKVYPEAPVPELATAAGEAVTGTVVSLDEHRQNVNAYAVPTSEFFRQNNLRAQQTGEPATGQFETSAVDGAATLDFPLKRDDPNNILNAPDEFNPEYLAEPAA